jgi:hypothetical protein
VRTMISIRSVHRVGVSVYGRSFDPHSSRSMVVLAMPLMQATPSDLRDHNLNRPLQHPQLRELDDR